MSKIGIDLKNPDIFPVRISLDPPNKEDTKSILMHYLKGRTTGEVNYDLITDKLMETGKSRGGIYSNSQIEDICVRSQKEGKSGISQNDILEYIQEEMKKSIPYGMTREINKGPAIIWKKIESFNEDIKKYMT
ncbi:MAG: hypothetical protein PHC34_04345 [Candidatus Gastranaerophilales bacterium]|nr:hypothetical protein [Candidatus Gastranaerophilales bacterium]